MKTYKIPATWQMYGILEVEADSLDDAIQKASGPEYSLPTNSAYVEDTFKVDFELVENYNEEMPFA
jgi:hypothetical protein